MSAKTTEEQLYERFIELDKRVDFPPENIQKKIAIISTPRCGSSLFCNVLKGTGLLGDPAEWLNMRYLKAYGQYTKNNNIDMNAYLEFVFRKTTSQNGVFAVNFHVEQYIELMKFKFDTLSLGFDHVYFLSRREKLDQAYSLAKASLTDQWSADAKSTHMVEEIERSSIFNALTHIVTSEDFYQKNLKQHTSREFYYEDFSDLDTPVSFVEVLNDTLTELPEDIVFQSSMRKQRTSEQPASLLQFKQYLSPSARW